MRDAWAYGALLAPFLWSKAQESTENKLRPPRCGLRRRANFFWAALFTPWCDVCANTVPILCQTVTCVNENVVPYHVPYCLGRQRACRSNHSHFTHTNCRNATLSWRNPGGRLRRLKLTGGGLAPPVAHAATFRIGIPVQAHARTSVGGRDGDKQISRDDAL